MILLIELVDIFVDFIKKYYFRDINYSIKKYMNVNKFILSYEHNIAKSKWDFTKYTFIVLTTYMATSLIVLSKFIIPIFEKYGAIEIWIKILSLVLVLVMVSICENLFRYFLSDVGDLKNVDMRDKEKLWRYKELVIILIYYLIPYILIFLSIITGKELFLIASLIMIGSLPLISVIYGRRFKKIENSVKKYYKNMLEIKTIDGLKKYKTSETFVQILSNNDLVVIETKYSYSNLIRANEVKYIRIENDLYYIKDGRYQLKEGYFKDKEKLKYKKSKNTRYRKRIIRKRNHLNAGI